MLHTSCRLFNEVLGPERTTPAYCAQGVFAPSGPSGMFEFARSTGDVGGRVFHKGWLETAQYDWCPVPCLLCALLLLVEGGAGQLCVECLPP